MADGSVRFIKETINSWKLNPHDGYPLGIRQDSNGFYHGPTAANPPGVYRKLASLSENDVVSSDAF